MGSGDISESIVALLDWLDDLLSSVFFRFAFPVPKRRFLDDGPSSTD